MKINPKSTTVLTIITTSGVGPSKYRGKYPARQANIVPISRLDDLQLSRKSIHFRNLEA
jgi:hypothetical protein